MAAFPRKHEPDFRKSADESRPGICNPPKLAALRAAQYPHRPGSQAEPPPRFLNEAMRPWAGGGSPGVPASHVVGRMLPALPRSHGPAIVAACGAVVAPFDEERGAATETFVPGGQDRDGIAGRRVRHDRRRKACRSDRDLADVCRMATVYDRRRLAVLEHPGAGGPAASRTRATHRCRPVVARNSGVPRARRRLPFHVCKDRSRARQTLAQVCWRTSSTSV